MIAKEDQNFSRSHEDTLRMRWHSGYMTLLTGGLVVGPCGFVLTREIVSGNSAQDNPWVLIPFLLAGLLIMGWGHGLTVECGKRRIRFWHGVVVPGLPSLPLYYKNFDADTATGIACYGVASGPGGGRGGVIGVEEAPTIVTSTLKPMTANSRPC